MEQEGAAFKAQYWRDFYRASLDRLEKASKGKLPVVFLAMMLLSGIARSATASPTCEVVLVDLTKSVATAGPDGETNLQKNLNAVTKILEAAPAGAHLK